MSPSRYILRVIHCHLSTALATFEIVNVTQFPRTLKVYSTEPNESATYRRKVAPSVNTAESSAFTLTVGVRTTETSTPTRLRMMTNPYAAA